MSKAIVIGAGIAGIASAIRLAIKGFEVQVLEANSYPGGKLSEIQLAGFRFDAGPSLFTMPQYVDELFQLAGKNPHDYFSYERLTAICNYFYEDGTRLTAWADKARFAQEIASKTNDSAESVIQFLKKSEEIYSITNHVFLEKSLHKPATYLNADTLKSLLRFPKIDPFRTMNQAVEAQFSDSRTRRFFNRYATYNGSDPYKAPATLNVIPHLEQHFGAFFPRGGMNAITDSLVMLAKDLGVQFVFNAKVDEIMLTDGKAAGVKMGNESISADVVVSNMDVWHTYKKLLSNHTIAPQKILSQERSSSALIFYWGIKTQFPELDLHNIFFSDDYKGEFDCIWQQKTVSKDPTIYINISSKYKWDDAPDGSENWFVMINVPANDGQNWDELIAAARKNIIEKINRNLNIDLASLITCEEILDPRSIESKTSSYQGSLYGTSSNSRFAAFFRHANFSSKIKDLYFVGGSVHPGGGIPLALLSAKITVEII